MPANIIQVQISDKRNAIFLIKVVGTNTIELYDTSTNMSCMPLACHTKSKALHLYKIYKPFLYILQLNVI